LMVPGQWTCRSAAYAPNAANGRQIGRLSVLCRGLPGATLLPTTRARPSHAGLGVANQGGRHL